MVGGERLLLPEIVAYHSVAALTLTLTLTLALLTLLTLTPTLTPPLHKSAECTRLLFLA